MLLVGLTERKKVSITRNPVSNKAGLDMAQPICLLLLGALAEPLL
tara:strand:- start:494 stop:628 length:135 start_codon:yes stop_codon:yes gene_type:complete